MTPAMKLMESVKPKATARERPGRAMVGRKRPRMVAAGRKRSRRAVAGRRSCGGQWQEGEGW